MIKVQITLSLIISNVPSLKNNKTLLNFVKSFFFAIYLFDLSAKLIQSNPSQKKSISTLKLSKIFQRIHQKSFFRAHEIKNLNGMLKFRAWHFSHSSNTSFAQKNEKK
jgi:hypothetical protein